MKPSEAPRPPATPSAWEEAERAGFDMSLIEHNLTLSVWERIRAHSRALAMALALREAMEKRDARSGF
jgi:hypothetical protein